MLETCLSNKIIRDFLNHYKQSRWQKLIPSLIEIAILNLHSSFHSLFFSEEDINNIIQELKRKQNKNIIRYEQKKKKDKTHIIFCKPSNKWRTADGGVEPNKSYSFRKNDNKDRDFLIDNSSISNHSTNNNRKKIKSTKSKIKEQVEMDKRKYYNKRYGDNNNYRKPINQIEKINYAISYDKNLQPELIEKTTFNKNKKGRKKIIQKMTQEEYEQQYPLEQNKEYNNENGNDYDYEEGDNEEHYEENKEEEYYELQAQNNHNYKNNIDSLDNNSFKNNNNIPFSNNQNKKRNNLYHYKNELINQNNNIYINNLKQSNNNSIKNDEENNNVELIQNPQQSFNPKYYKNSSEQASNELNPERNNNINIENNYNDQQSPNIGYKYNPISNSQYNINNYKGGISESDDKSSKLIGIEKKYQKKIDELEQNFINNNNNDNNNNIDNYANKLKVNVTNMEEYTMKKGINSNEYINNKNNYNNNNMNNNQEENIDDENNDNFNEEMNNYQYNNNINDINEENQLSDSEMNDEGVLSQMSNMTERTKLLLKKTMDEYPPMEEDTFYDQNSLTK